MNTLTGELPRHQYCFVDSAHTHKEPQGFLPAVWFGLVSYPGRLWGCTVMLESGCIYRNLPLHVLASRADPEVWQPRDAATWDCYGLQWSSLEYGYLKGLDCKARLRDAREIPGQYLFSVSPLNDGFSACPEQAKEFTFISLDNGRFTAQPTDRVIFRERSFTGPEFKFPKGLKRQTDIFSAE